MGTKIALLCVNPWEGFLPMAFQSCGREYYERIREMSVFWQRTLYCQECVEVYGESVICENRDFFSEYREQTQLLYIQSGSMRMIEKVFQKADVVMMGLPECKEEFDKSFMRIFPWKDQVKFLWHSQTHSEKKFVAKFCSEYKLNPAQLFELSFGEDENGKKKQFPFF